MDWHSLIGPAVVAAIVSGVVAAIGFFVNRSTAITLHTQRLDVDRELAERKVNADIALAERKFQLDANLADRKRKQELAEEALSGFYRVNDLVRAIRAPMSFANEAKDRPKPNDESDSVARQRDTYYPIIARYEARRQEIADLLAKRYRIAASFGKAADEPFQLLHEALHEVVTSAQLLIAWSGDGTREADPALWKKMKGDIWWGAATPDSIATRIEAAIEKMETICRPILEGEAI
jgi:hypothetical protein